MAYNEKLEEQIDGAIKRWQHIEKKKMFGGVGYLLKGNMSFGILEDFLIVRMEKDLASTSLQARNIKPFDVTGKPMSGWIMVEESGWKTQAGLAKWLEKGKQFALSLPEKKKEGVKAKKKKKTKTLKEYRR